MKKLIFTLVFLLMAIPAFSQNILNQSSGTVGWDASAPPKDGAGVNIPGIMKYQVYTRNDLVSTGTKVGVEITALQLLITSFTPYTTYYVGIEAVFYATATPTIAKRSTEKAWSNDPAVCLNGNTFGFLYEPPINKPGGVRLLSLLKTLKDIPS
jgi:hypothetical protein